MGTRKIWGVYCYLTHVGQGEYYYLTKSFNELQSRIIQLQMGSRKVGEYTVTLHREDRESILTLQRALMNSRAGLFSLRWNPGRFGSILLPYTGSIGSVFLISYLTKSFNELQSRIIQLEMGSRKIWKNTLTLKNCLSIL